MTKHRIPYWSAFVCLISVSAWSEPVGGHCEKAGDPAPELAVTIPDSTVTMRFRYIPPGTFGMGSLESDPDGREDEKPFRQVTITKAFYIQLTELTQGQWEAVTGNNPATGRGVGPDYPVYLVSWVDVMDYFLPRVNVLDIGTFRLPTEAEWEYACRAGTTTRFYYGDDPDAHEDWEEHELANYAWYGYQGWFDPGTHPVCQKPPNPWGLCDMLGNVMELVQEGYWKEFYRESDPVDPVAPSPYDLPPGESGNPLAAGRGGSWISYADHVRVADRHLVSIYNRNHAMGFRLVMEVPGQEDEAPEK